MNKKQGLLWKFKGVAALLVLPLVPSFAAPPASSNSPHPFIKLAPYGTVRLENTDQTKFAASILDQFKAANIPAPKKFVPFPDKTWKGKTGYATTDTIIGISKDDSSLNSYVDFFNRHFENQPRCAPYSSTLHINWSIKVDLHEDTHYVSFHLVDENGFDLNDRAFSKINQLSSPQDPDSYIHDLKKTLKKARADKSPGAREKIRFIEDQLVVAKGTSVQIRERIGEVGAVLYGLSNYSDTNSVIEFYEKLAETRMAAFYDYGHPTASAIRFAIKTFMETPTEKRSGLTIIETAKWTAKIVESLPEFQKTIPEIAEDIRQAEYVRKGLLRKNKKDKNFFTYFIRGENNQAHKTQPVKMPDYLISSRNAACGVSLPALSMR